MIEHCGKVVNPVGGGEVGAVGGDKAAAPAVRLCLPFCLCLCLCLWLRLRMCLRLS